MITTKIVQSVIVLTLFTCGIANAQGVATPQKPTPPAAVSDAAVNDAAAKRLAVALQKKLSAPNDDLVQTARSIARPLIASFRHDLNLARVDQRRVRMVDARLSILEMANKAANERRLMLKQLRAKLEEIKEQYSDSDGPECEQSQIQVVKVFQPRLQHLQSYEDQLREKADETSTQLESLRSETLARESDRWLAENAPILTPAERNPIPRLKWIKTLTESKKQITKTSETTTRTTTQKTLKEVLKTIDKFDDGK